MTALKAPKTTAELKPIETAIRRDLVIKAIKDFDLFSSPAWAELNLLSTHTELEGVEPSPYGMYEVIGQDAVDVIGDVYLKLNYGGKADSLSVGESFPFHALIRLDGDKEASVEAFEVDTSSFSE